MSTQLSFTLDQGASLTYTFMVQDSVGAAFSLTGCSAVLMVRKVYSSTAPSITASTVNGKLVVTNAIGGQLTWNIIPADTTGIAFASPDNDTLDMVYDMEITNASGFVYKAARGTITLNREVTR